MKDGRDLMNIELNTLKDSLVSIANIIGILKPLIDSLPKGKKKTEATAALIEAENQWKLVKATTMQSLGYEICRNHEMPEIMQSKDDLNWECPKCNNKKFTGMKSMPDPFE
jgi:hypothetical protein